MNQKSKCPICGKIYETYSHYVGDQSKCGACRSAEEKAVRSPDTEEQKRRRAKYFSTFAILCVLLAGCSPNLDPSNCEKSTVTYQGLRGEKRLRKVTIEFLDAPAESPK